MDQLSFASLDYATKKKRTKREAFLAEMAAVVPWAKLEAVIEPHYPKSGPQGGRLPFPLPVMLRIYCLQQWYGLSDPGAEEALYDIHSMRAFAGLELGRDAIPDETTILNFRHLLERHDLTKAIFAAVAEHLEARGAMLRGGTIVDATLIAASPSTKNKQQKRDPAMRSSKKGNQWYFGMKAHVGVDAKSGLVHTAGVTTGSVHDAKVMDHLIREDDRAVYGDKGYASDEKKRAAEDAGVLWAVKEKAKPFSASLLRGDDRDLDQHLRIGELGLNAGAAGKVLTLGPRVPGFVHGIPQTDVGHPDGGGYHLRLVSTAKLQETIDFLENLLGLPLGVLLAVRGSDTGGKHKAIGLDDLGQKFRWFVTRDGHGVFLLDTL